LHADVLLASVRADSAAESSLRLHVARWRHRANCSK